MPAPSWTGHTKTEAWMHDGGQGLRRREFLVGGAGAGLAVALPINYAALARASRLPMAKGGKFAHGVASGLPSTKGITLWTRVSDITKSAKLNLEIATDKNFRKLVDQQKVTADSKRDFTVHAPVKGLDPATEYFYRFDTGDKSSKVGKFRTLPPSDSKTPIRIGYLSCQSYEAGYYNAQAGLAKEKDLDLILFLGDYIYERHYYNGPADRADTTGANGDGDVQTLPEYRAKYRLGQSDKNLQALHEAYPFVSVWDDHEVEDNYAGDQQDSAEPDPSLENNGTPRRVPFGDRRKNAYKAFFEAMPRIQQKGNPNQIYGSMQLGGLVELFFTDQRQYRDPQPCNDVQLQACADDDNPARTMLGSKQKTWFKKALNGSKSPWKLWASEVMLMSVDASPGQHSNHDSWDGYGAERKEILEGFLAAGGKNLVALTGDIHTFFAGDLGTNGESTGQPVGVELVGGSATSFGLPEELGVPSSALAALAGADPHIKFFDFDKRGYAVVEASKKELTAEFKSVDTMTKGAKPVSLAKFQVNSGTPAVNQV
jgi:alkaline phosphatase D